MSPFLFHFSAALDCILDARISFSIFIFFHPDFCLSVLHMNSVKYDQIDWVEYQKVPRLWGWIVSLMEKDKMTGQESAVKREIKRVSFTNQRGGGRIVCISKRETDHVHSWQIFLSNFRYVDEFIRCEIASKLCIITFSAANCIAFCCRENVIRKLRQMREWRKVLLCTGKHAEYRETKCGVNSHSRNYQRNLSIVILYI